MSVTTQYDVYVARIQREVNNMPLPSVLSRCVAGYAINPMEEWVRDVTARLVGSHVVEVAAGVRFCMDITAWDPDVVTRLSIKYGVEYARVKCEETHVWSIDRWAAGINDNDLIIVQPPSDRPAPSHWLGQVKTINAGIANIFEQAAATL